MRLNNRPYACMTLNWSRPVHTTSPKEFKVAKITGYFGFVFEEYSIREIIWFPMPSFSKGSVFKMFSFHATTKKPVFSNSFDFKSVFENLRFRDGLVWTVVLTVEIKLRFQISPAYCERCLVAVAKKQRSKNLKTHPLESKIALFVWLILDVFSWPYVSQEAVKLCLHKECIL